MGSAAEAFSAILLYAGIRGIALANLFQNLSNTYPGYSIVFGKCDDKDLNDEAKTGM